MIDMKQIGKRLKAIREARGLKQKDLAAALGIGRPYLSRIENGDILLSSHLLLKLKELINISINYLLTGEGSSETPFTIDDNDLRLLLKCCTENPRVKHAVLSYFFEYLEKVQTAATPKSEPGPGGSRY